MSRRVLILAYHYPPEPTSGAQRMAFLARYLPEFGWEPTVITRTVRGNGHSSPSVIRVGCPFATTWVASNKDAESITSSPLSGLKRTVKHVVFFPDRAASWIPHAVAAAKRAYRENPFDAIISSALPGSAHIAASILARKLNLPWVADYRDLWSGNPYADEPPWREKILAALEKRTLRRVDGLTTITEDLAASLAAMHGRSVAAIPNGFDISEWDDVPFCTPDVFRIVHAGSLYDCRRDPEQLFSQLGALRWEGLIPELRIDFYGPSPGNLLERARRHGIEDSVRYHGVIEREDVKREERSASLLLIIQNSDPNTASEYGSKVFEYQAAGPNVLALGPEKSVLRSYIAQNEMGWFAHSDGEIREALLSAYRLHLERRTVRPNAHAAKNSAKTIAQRFASLLDETLAAGQVFELSTPVATGRTQNEAASLR